MVKKPGGNKRFQQNRNYIRKNDKIRAREVRVIGADGEMLGVMPPEEAVKIAKSHGRLLKMMMKFCVSDQGDMCVMNFCYAVNSKMRRNEISPIRKCFNTLVNFE